MGAIWRQYAPHILMTLVQLCYTFLYFITEAAFNRGLNPYVYVTYRHILVAIVLWPFAYYHERKLRPRMTWLLFLEISVLSLVGISLTLNMYFASLKYTSPTFVTAMINTIASVTFVIAIILRLEIVDIRSPRGLAKITGTVVSFAGVTIMTLYKGAVMTSLWKAPIRIPGSSVAHESWLKGSFLAVVSCICWSVWYVMQAMSLKRYPAQLSLTAWMCTVGGIQSAIFTVFPQHKPEDWLIGFGIKFWCIIYCGIVCTGFTIFIQLWCTKQKGPVFVTMFSPLSTIMVAFLAYFIFGERLYLGSIIGGAVVIVGLYMLLWGKEKDQGNEGSNEQEPNLDCEKQSKLSNVSAMQNDSERDQIKGLNGAQEPHPNPARSNVVFDEQIFATSRSNNL